MESSLSNLTLQQRADFLLRRLDASKQKYEPGLMNDLAVILHDLIASLPASKPPEASLLSTLTPLLTDVFTSAPLGQAEIYLSQFGTHVSVSWRNAQTGK
jgi:hypothetical protein